MTADANQRWKVRVLRAQELQEQFSTNVNALRFYQRVLDFQHDVAAWHNVPVRHDVPLRKQIDIRAVGSEMPALLSLSMKFGPDVLRREAEAIHHAGKSKWIEMLESALSQTSPLATNAEDFVSRACLQPFAENLQSQLNKDPHHNGAACPACGGVPQMAVLRPEGEGAIRSLVCSFCLCEWTFRRVVCAWCGEENKEKLPRYSAEQITSIHVEACDSCHRYVKAVDLTVDGHAVPVVDEAGSAVLDVWAVERGYTKIIPNLIGF